MADEREDPHALVSYAQLFAMVTAGASVLAAFDEIRCASMFTSSMLSLGSYFSLFSLFSHFSFELSSNGFCFCKKLGGNK